MFYSRRVSFKYFLQGAVVLAGPVLLGQTVVEQSAAPWVVDQGTVPWATLDLNSGSIRANGESILACLETIKTDGLGVGSGASGPSLIAKMCDKTGASVFKDPENCSVFKDNLDKSVFRDDDSGASWLDLIHLVLTEEFAEPEISPLEEPSDVEEEATESTSQMSDLTIANDEALALAESDVDMLETCITAFSEFQVVTALGTLTSFDVPAGSVFGVQTIDFTEFAVPIAGFRLIMLFGLGFMTFFLAMGIVRQAIA